jgi:hypothetical protein
MKKALSSSETSVLTIATRRKIPGEALLHIHRRENLKTYMGNPLYLRQAQEQPISRHFFQTFLWVPDMQSTV